jgi:DNA-binding transcriptional LysR family regulator
MNVNLKLMHTFLLVAEHSSFCRAAEVSNRSQSAVSMQIRQLELQLGVSLFHRTTRRVQLTREGELLLVCARNAVAELQTGLRQIKDAVDIQRGRLTLACAPTLAATRLPGILATFQKSYPGVTAHVRELASVEMLDCIRRQDVDFGIGPRSPNATEFQFQPILLDEIYALIPTCLDVTQQRETITLLELSHMPTLVLKGSSAMHGMLDKAQKAAGVTLNIKYEVQQVQTQIAMATAGLGAAILPRIAIPLKPDPRVRAVPIVDPPLVRELCVVTLRGQLLSPVAARFVEMLQRLITRPEAGGDIGAETPIPRLPSRPHRAHLALATQPVS